MINCDIYFEKYLAENLVTLFLFIFLNLCDIKIISYLPVVLMCLNCA